ncbi:hypothetical protein HJFPF1_02499 [Paramyrothecium foliicola]|nr:hypothetical protein HJFPF1_02499 [Paramyrothecium foliicola]
MAMPAESTLPLPDDYDLSIANANFVNGTLDWDSSFKPIPELASGHADVTMFLLSANQVQFTNKSADPWYKVSKPSCSVTDEYLGGKTTWKSYSQDSPPHIIACKSRYQFCNPNLPAQEKCTALATRRDAGVNLRAVFPDEAAYQRAYWLRLASWALGNDMFVVSTTLGANSLRSRESFFAGIQGPIPDNQWQLDMQHWFEVGITSMKRAIVDSALGNPKSAAKIFVRPSGGEQQKMCRNQKIRSTEHVSFSLFGLLFILFFGAAVISTSLSIQFLPHSIPQKLSCNPYSGLEWTTNGALQLQRLAQEELGFGHWLQTDGYIPFTSEGTCLASLDISNRKHPRLRPVSTLADVKNVYLELERLLATETE